MAKSAKIYRCGQCDEDWPLEGDYKRCPKCNTSCAEVKIEEALTPDGDDAKRKAAYYKFERYLVQESDQQRQRRQAKYKTEHREKFDQVIAEGGFADWERENILSLEKELRAQEARMRAD